MFSCEQTRFSMNKLSHLFTYSAGQPKGFRRTTGLYTVQRYYTLSQLFRHRVLQILMPTKTVFLTGG